MKVAQVHQIVPTFGHGFISDDVDGYVSRSLDNLSRRLITEYCPLVAEITCDNGKLIKVYNCFSELVPVSIYSDGWAPLVYPYTFINTVSPQCLANAIDNLDKVRGDEFKPGKIMQPLECQRRLLGLTQIQLAEMTGISQQNISRFEKGGQLNKASCETLKKLSKALRCTIDDLLY